MLSLPFTHGRCSWHQTIENVSVKIHPGYEISTCPDRRMPSLPSADLKMWRQDSGLWSGLCCLALLFETLFRHHGVYIICIYKSSKDIDTRIDLQFQSTVPNCWIPHQHLFAATAGFPNNMPVKGFCIVRFPRSCL